MQKLGRSEDDLGVFSANALGNWRVEVVFTEATPYSAISAP